MYKASTFPSITQTTLTAPSPAPSGWVRRTPRNWSAATCTRQSCTTIASGRWRYTLPEEYIDEVELERQRKIHDSLITMGLKLISDSYLDGMSRLCGESGLEFEPRMMDGKHHLEILKDLAGSRTTWW